MLMDIGVCVRHGLHHCLLNTSAATLTPLFLKLYLQTKEAPQLFKSI